MLGEGLISTFSSRKTNNYCPDNKSVLSVPDTTDKQPSTTSWLLMDKNTGEVLHNGSYTSQEATYAEEFAAKKTRVARSPSLPHAEGFNAPGRYDLYLDGLDVGHGGLSGRVKREYVGDCTPCPDDMSPMPLLFTEQSTANISWTFSEKDSLQVIDEGGSYEDAMIYYDDGNWKFTYWFGNDICIKRSRVQCKH